MADRTTVKVGANDDRMRVKIGASNATKVLRADRERALRDLIDVDVDTNGVGEGYIIKFDATTRKFTTSQILDGGEF